jgi:hypothetical protein
MGKPWFHPKEYGYGSGLPCSWEGWVVLAIFLAVSIGASSAIREDVWKLPAAVIAIDVVVLVVICAAKTRGGWRWRWGQE